MYDDFEEQSGISKTRRKREAHALQDLGEALVRLDPATLKKIPLNDDLRDAISAAQKLKKHGSLKRQLQYIGKLMRNIDADPIRAAYETVTNHYRTDIQQLHQLEEWRDRLISQGDSILSELLNAYPNTDRQHLRQLIRSAQKERNANKPPRAARELFQYLKSLMIE